MIFNSVKNHRESSTVVRHNEDRETPSPVYLGLMIHAVTRKRDIIDKLHKLGLSISYDRVLHFSADLANKVCKQYEVDGVVCPPNLRKHLFTTAAVDNIDHNPSSMTANDSFHGTAISLTNHVSDGCLGDECNAIHSVNLARSKTIANLPTSYTVISPASLHNQNPVVPQLQHSIVPTFTPAVNIIQQEHKWLRLYG